MSKSGCPTCGCELYQEHGPCAGTELLEALRPFADALKGGVHEVTVSGVETGHKFTLSLDDFRRAEAAIAKAEGKE